MSVLFSNSHPAAPGGQSLVTFQIDPATGEVSAAYTASGGGGSSIGGVNKQTVNYALASGDAGKIVVMKGTGLTATLLNPPPSATWIVLIANNSTTQNLTVSRNGLTIDDVAADLVLPPMSGVYIATDGTNYYTERGLPTDTNMSLSNVTTNNVTTGRHGFVPILPNDATKFFDGTGNYSTPASGAPTVTTVATTNDSFTAGQTRTYDLSMGKGNDIYKITEATGKMFRFRLYSTSAARTADASRPYTIPLNLGTSHQCILDFYCDQSLIVTPFQLTPAILGANGDNSMVATLYASVTNIDTATRSIQVTLTYVVSAS
jgi:hypothetical protein